MEFLLQLMGALQANAYNFYISNYDIDRPRDRKTWWQQISLLIQKGLMIAIKKPQFVFLAYPDRRDLAALNSYRPYLPNVARLYDLLADEKSRKLLISLFAYKILGKERVKLPLATKDYRNVRKSLYSLETGAEKIFVQSMNLWLAQYDLTSLGYKMKIFAPKGGIHVPFVSKQYEYPDSTPPFIVQPGDIIFDAGAGFGDTAFRFASETGEMGKVYSFEFVSKNLEVIRRTIQLNPTISKRIEIVERPVWSTSNVCVHWKDGGASTRVAGTNNEVSQFSSQTISIDDFVEDRKIYKVNFIKMDVEGAELEALKGATKTIKQFKPKLAIALYHKLEDFWTIPDFLQSLEVGYRFYLGHYTIYEYETVLYALI